MVLDTLHSTRVWGARTLVSLAQQCFLQQEPFPAPGTHLEACPACGRARRSCRPVVKLRGASGAGENQRGPAVRAGGVQRTPVMCTPSAFSQKRLVGAAQGCLSGCCAALIAGGEEMGRELCSGAENYPRPFGQWCFGPWVVEYVVSPFFTGFCSSSDSSWPAGKCSMDTLPTRFVSIFQCSENH